MKKTQNEKLKVVIISLVDKNKTLKPKKMKELRAFKKSYDEMYRINLLIGEMNSSITNYLRPSNNSTAKRYHCSMINALVERIGKDFIKAEDEDAFKKNPIGQRIIGILKKYDLKFQFRHTTIEVPAVVKEMTAELEPELEEVA